jgi:hypothetical protein
MSAPHARQINPHHLPNDCTGSTGSCEEGKHSKYFLTILGITAVAATCAFTCYMMDDEEDEDSSEPSEYESCAEIETNNAPENIKEIIVERGGKKHGDILIFSDCRKSGRRVRL